MAYEPNTNDITNNILNTGLIYNVLNYGVVADDSTDDTAAWNALFATVLANGGGTVVGPAGKTSLCSGPLQPFPFVSSSTVSPGLRICGAGTTAPGDTGLGPTGGAFILDLRYAGTGYTSTTVAAGSNGGEISAIASWSSPSAGVLDVASSTAFPTHGTITVATSTTTATVNYTGKGTGTLTGCTYVSGSATGTVATGGAVALVVPAKIDCRGHGQLELDHLTIKSGGTDDFPFFQTTNTAVYGHDLSLFGHSANSGIACVQDGFILGGTSATDIETGAADAAFQGYSTRFERVFFENIRIGFNAQASCNGVVFNKCVFSSTCGGDTTHGAFTAGSSALPAVGNTYNDNLIEITHYPYAFVFIATATNNTGIGNALFDESGTSVATCSDASGNTGNRFSGTYSSIAGDAPDTMSVTRVNGNTTFTPCVNGNYLIECLGGGGQGGGGSGNATGSGGGGGGSGGVTRQTQTLVSGTAYTCTIGTGGTGAGGGGGTNANGTAGNNGGTTTFAGPTNLLASGGGGGGGGVPSGNTASAGAWSLAALVAAANILGPGIGGVSIAGVVGTAGTGPVDLAAGGGGGGGCVSGGKGGSGGNAGAYTTISAAAGSTGGSATTAGGNGANAAANSGGGGGGAGCGDANTGGTGGSGGSGHIKITGPYPAN